MSTIPNPLVSASPDRLGGTPVFTRTRVPVRSRLDYLEAGHPLDHFVEQFPSVSREHAVAVREWATRILLIPAA
jgi:uncharacterized protein (DUF433 family)